MKNRHGPPEIVKHGDVIDANFWTHQINKMIMDARAARNIIVGSNGCMECFDHMELGQVMIITKYGDLVGIVKDSAKRYRFIALPEQDQLPK